MKIHLPKTLFVQPFTYIAFPLLLMFTVHPSLANSIAGIKDTIVVSKKQGNNKYKIKIYPNATHEVLFFTVSGEEKKIYQLFIFDVDGKLVKQTAVRDRQTGFLAKLNKGNYVYEVFSDDERIENGDVVVK